MTLSSSIVALAAPTESTREENDVEGIERFFAKEENGTMSLNVEMAKADGYSDKAIQFVLSNIENINELVLTQGVHIDENYSVTIYNESSANNSGLSRAARAVKGQSKVVVWATGMVLVYMNTSEVNDLYNTIDNLGWVCTILSILGYVTTARPILSQACNAAAFVGGVTISLYKSQINQVKKNGTGIIMYVTPMPDGGSSVSFGAQ
ncbi:MAG: hypothetical protein MRZ65_01305 [Lachnospiraceae bacterium]|nr:hypothetical protein [Lachnospiraceae bacterium]